jgi:hypothetical protein
VADGILGALAHLVKREIRGEPQGDILERAVAQVNRFGGNTFRLTQSLGLGNPLSTGAGFDLQRLPPDVYTVRIQVADLLPYNDTAPKVITSAFADIAFGATGVSRRRISLVQGCAISASCTFITINVYDNTPAQIGAAGAVALQYNVTLTVASGLRGVTEQPPVLMPTDANGFALTPAAQLLAPGSQLIVPIPPNVGVQSFQCSVVDATGIPLPAGAAIVQQLAPGRLVLTATDPRSAPGWFPLVSGAQAVQLNNIAGRNDVQFSLLFGVEG